MHGRSIPSDRKSANSPLGSTRNTGQSASGDLATGIAKASPKMRIVRLEGQRGLEVSGRALPVPGAGARQAALGVLETLGCAPRLGFERPSQAFALGFRQRNAQPLSKGPLFVVGLASSRVAQDAIALVQPLGDVPAGEFQGFGAFPVAIRVKESCLFVVGGPDRARAGRFRDPEHLVVIEAIDLLEKSKDRPRTFGGHADLRLGGFEQNRFERLGVRECALGIENGVAFLAEEAV